MAKQTINIGASPNDGTGTPLRTAFDYTNQNFTELYTATGPSGNNIVVPGNATITGDLTAARLIVTGGTIPTNGLWLPTTNTLEFAANSLAQYRIAPLGVFSWYDGAGGTRMTLNATGLGVGGSPSRKLSVVGTTSGVCDFYATSYRRYAIGSEAKGFVIYDDNAAAYRMEIDASGNVGVGVTPSAWLTAVKALDIGSQAMGIFSGGITHNAYFDNTDGRWEYKGNGAATYWNIQGGIHQWYVAASGIANNPITTFSSAAMTLDASGNLLVRRTGAGLDNTSGVTIAQSSIGMQTEGNATQIAMNRTTSDGTIVDIRRNNSTVGTIAVTTGGTTYNSISDYRLKEAVQPLVGGLARVSALKPSIYKWKSNGSSGEGFIAHELADVVPAAVTGEKDAVNEDGTVNPQGVDLSKVVPILVAAIQELTARVQTLETR
jgi:hypothetical protein